MMKNKVLVKLIVPELNESFDVFVPVNEYVWKIKKLFVKSISDLLSVNISIQDNFILINKDTCMIYDDNAIVINTDIQNGSNLIFIGNNSNKQA